MNSNNNDNNNYKFSIMMKIMNQKNHIIILINIYSY